MTREDAIKKLIGFESTYKELKLRRVIRRDKRILVLSLPIRNWNFNCQGTSLPHQLGFESTYKELKQDSNGQVVATVQCFESTYKELKLPYIGFAS